jgi:PAS domain-containing protein
VTLFVGQVADLRRQRASQAAGFAAVIIAAAVLIGGWVGPPLLSSWVAGFPPMRPSSALCVAALGLALVYPGKNSRFAFAVGLAAVAAAAVGLGLILFKADPETGIDAWLAPRAAVEGPGAVPFRLATVVALAEGLAGGSLALSRFERHRLAATMLGSIAGAMMVFALLGYLTGIDTLYGSVSVNSPTLPATVGLLCVAAGIILRIGPVPALRQPRPLWHLLVMLGCANVAPLLLFGAYAGFRIPNAQLDQVRGQLMSEARNLSAGVDREIIGEIERLQALAASQSLRQGDFAEFQRQAEASLAMRQSGNIMLIDRNMQQLVNTWVPFGTSLEKAGLPEPVERAFTTGKPQVTGVFMGPVTHQPVFAISVPVQIDGESRYALVRSPGQHALASLAAANAPPPGWRAVVSDAAHRIIARSEQEGAFVGKELPASQWYGAGPGGVFEFIDSEGRPSLEGYAWSELTGWQTSVWAPKALLETPVRALWRTIGVMGLLAFALVVALASWLGRIIARSVGHAARAAIALGESGPLPPSRTPVAEVNTLMAELRGTAARRQAAENLLRESKDRLQLAMDAAQLGSWQYDPRHRVVSGDARSKEISTLPLTRRRSRRSRDGCIRTTRKAFGQSSRPRSIPSIRSAPRPSSGSGRETERSAGWRLWGSLISRAPAMSDGPRASSAPLRTLPNARSARKRSTSSCAKSVIAPRTCSPLCTRSLTRPPPKIPKISSSASQSASRGFQPVRTCSSGATGTASRLRTLFTLSSRISPASLVLVSPCTAPSCA